jgi:hypothetical protein
MTAAEMHAAVAIELQQIASFVYDDFEPEEIDHYLNKAQEDFVQALSREFEGDNVVKAEIRSLVKEQVLLQPIAASDFPEGNSYEFLIPYPADFWYLLVSESGITRSANPVIGSKVYVPNIDIKNDDLRKVRVTPFHNPYIRYPYVSQMEDFLHIFVDTETTLIDQKVRYIREPVRILWHPDNNDEENFDCELPSVTHDRIVEIAVSLMRRDIPARSNAPVQSVNPA